MSLTSHLKDPASPVRAWFDTRLSNNTTVLVSRSGALLRALDIAAEAADRIVALEPATRAANDVDWGAVAPLCALLARYEQAARSPFAAASIAARLQHAEPALEAHVGAVVSAADCADIAAIAAHIAADQADLRDAQPLLLGPTFALSADLGGADADIIAGRTLIDLKAGAALPVVRKRDIYQVIGYALADVDDEHCIDIVAIHALRWRTRWSIGLQELLDSLAGEPTDIAILRREFATVIPRPSSAPKPVGARERTAGAD